MQAQTGSATTQYLYTLGTRPLAQKATAWEYLLPDALGSMRQIADTNGKVTLAKSYEPYGSVLNSSGSGTSVYGFTGEQTDSRTGLLFLRARYLQLTLGIFLARDPWSGNQLRPGSMNGFAYTEGNPINRIDPTGQIQWQRPSSDYEKMVEWHYELTDPDNIHLEFRYISSRPDKTTYERPDIILPDEGDVYEIEPYNIGGISLAVNEATYYANELNSVHARPSMRGTLPPPNQNVHYDWREVFWRPGNSTKFQPFDIPTGQRVISVRGEVTQRVPDCLTFHAESPATGAIVWGYIYNLNNQDCPELTTAELATIYGALAKYIVREWQPPSAPAPVPVPIHQESPEADWLAALLILLQQCWQTVESLGPVIP